MMVMMVWLWHSSKRVIGERDKVISMEDGLVPNEEDEDEVALVDGVLDGTFGGDGELGLL